MNRCPNLHSFVYSAPTVALPQRLDGIALTAAILLLFVALPGVRGQDIRLASDAPSALPPEESRQLFRLPPGFRIELVASEPHVADPVAMAFDAGGRILVCEIHGYNLEGYLDVLELNKTGELDTQVRRILANDEAVKQADEEQYGTVKLLEDTDGDGRIDHSTVLADRLPPCYGVVPARDGVIVFCAPEIIFLADRDGDGAAEVRETLFAGFGVGEMWTRINNPRWGVDNWIYGVSGAGSAGTISGPRLAAPVSLGSVCFRFRADGSALEAASGTTHGFGQATDDWGDRFLCTNQQHAMHVIPIPNRYLVRNPYFAAPDLTRNISAYGHPARVYPTSQPDPWRRARAADPAWVRFYGEAEATASGYFTAASGQTIYQGGQFPPEFHGNHFSVDNAQNLIHRCLLKPDGVSYAATRPNEHERTEFLTSSEQWFRPVNLTTGPDGSLYVVDMYRDIIEDYSAIPRYLQQLYVQSLIAGSDKGRIWRIVREDARLSKTPDLSRATTAELVSHLARDNYWERTTAQRLILERQDAAAAATLRQLFQARPTPQARLHALYTLDGLGALTPDLLLQGLRDTHFAVRVHALRMADERLNEHPTLLASLLPLVDDPHPRVRLQSALSLGESDSAAALDALIQLAVRYDDEPWMKAAILSSTVESAERMLDAIVGDESPEGRSNNLLRPLVSMIGARRDAHQVSETLSTLSRLQDDSAIGIQVSCLEGLMEGLQRGRQTAIGTPQAIAALRLLLTSRDPQVRSLAVHTASQIRVLQVPEMQLIFDQQRRLALDDAASGEVRKGAIRLLAASSFDDFAGAASKLLDPRQAIEIQLATVEAVQAVDHPDAASLLLRGFPSYTPRVRAAVMTAVFARRERLLVLLQAIERGDVPRSSLDAVRREQLMNDSKKEIAALARRLLSTDAGEPTRQSVLAEYVQSLKMPRNTARGKAVFEKQCAKCHRLGDQGHEVGPDLLTAKTRADETLLSDVLDPSNQITVGYNQYTVITVSGRIFTGILASETPTSITLRAEEKKDTTILRKDIDEMVASTVSMMPEDLEKQVTLQDVADLLGFLRQTLGSAQPNEVVLFDDDPQFLRLLTEGDGRARLDWEDPHCGDASLAMSPPQRFSAMIPGWEFQIAEHPGPGQYRYLRFAWKQPRGDGLMIELADDGQWPQADESHHRYYSGKNTTGWNAVRVCAGRPKEWTVVTRDLWKDCGSFRLTGIAPTAMGGEAKFDRIELLRSVDSSDNE